MNPTCEECKLRSTSIQLKWRGDNQWDMVYCACGHEKRIEFESADLKMLFQESFVDSVVLNLRTPDPVKATTATSLAAAADMMGWMA